MISTVVTLTLAVTLATSVAVAEQVFVEAGDLGLIRGFTLRTSQTFRVYNEFDGIPYAEDVTGTNRFKPSKLREGPLTEDGSAFNATNAFAMCPQSLGPSFDSFEPLIPDEVIGQMANLGSENCLKLNIRTPDLNPPELLPVIVYIHGGGFTGMWGGFFNGGRIMEKDVVLVPINYRLGVLGFFNLETDDAPGNAGLYDMLEALKWVQKYIHHFGGDPTRVTIAGQSAGAAAVTHLLVSPLGEGLFHQAIAGSGAASLEWATAADPLPHAMRVAELAGCANATVTDKAEIVLCMQQVPHQTLLEAMSNYTTEEQLNGGFGYAGASPSIQKGNLSIPKILTEDPLKTMLEKRQKNIPLMMGTTNHDGSGVLGTLMDGFLIPNNYLEDPKYIRDQLLIDIVNVFGLTDRTEAMIDALGVTFMGMAQYSDEIEPKYQGLIDILSVLAFKAMGFKTIQLHSQLNPDSYWYSFDFEGFWSLFGLINPHDFPAGVSHADDLLYLFQFLPLLNENEKDVSRRYVDFHTNFAIYGNPNGAGEEVWPSYSEDNPSYLRININDTVGNNYKQDWKNASAGLFFNETEQRTPQIILTDLF